MTINKQRQAISDDSAQPEQAVLKQLLSEIHLDPSARQRIGTNAAQLIEQIRSQTRPNILSVFLEQYSLSTQEGIALMCLAEALLRVPDSYTIDELIEDKIAPSDWHQHLSQSNSSLVNASTWALMLTGKILKEEPPGLIGNLRALMRRLGEPVIRKAIAQALRELGHAFVLGQTIDEALIRAKSMEAKGYFYSYDMLGEAAVTYADAKRHFNAYSAAITAISTGSNSGNIHTNPGISVKLSALHPRYELLHKKEVMKTLLPLLTQLCLQAKAANIGLNIDAEEASRLDLSLIVIETIAKTPELKQWDGLGVVVQAYGLGASAVVDWLYQLANQTQRKLMLRLVKGAYWDSEIKWAQTKGLAHFPVFTYKSATDLSYLALAQKLLGMRDKIYPQFATHNAHSLCTIIELAGGKLDGFEFQRLHGMGEELHQFVTEQTAVACRIYAPVGSHQDLLAYLVRRLLENGANSSFVNQITNKNIAADRIVADPITKVKQLIERSNFSSNICLPDDLYQPIRQNSKGYELGSLAQLADIKHLRAAFKTTHCSHYQASAIIAADIDRAETSPTDVCAIVNPANLKEQVGSVQNATVADVETALSLGSQWSVSVSKRAKILNQVADLYQQNQGLLFALLTREAGKTITDAISELREAVDFLRYYASEAVRIETVNGSQQSRGVIVCISPWNFPLAIFTGQIAAALAAGNAVIAKPAEQTPLIAFVAIKLMHQAGVPQTSLQLLSGEGSVIGSALCQDSRVKGICFTGSTDTAKHIHRNIADYLSADTLFLAETGGINAMIVDSTALKEQAIIDIVASAFQSAGQRCSALRMLYVQQEVFEAFKEMLIGAMQCLTIGNPWKLACDVGPVIDNTAANTINQYIANAAKHNKLIFQCSNTPSTQQGYFVMPALIAVDGIDDIKAEVFGPVLHIASYCADKLNDVVSAINQSGYGLTFGIHSRIDNRIEQIVSQINAGNIYVNRNQIGAVVGTQPFGGEGLSGTGPKAGGPAYVKRFYQPHSTMPVNNTVELPRYIDYQTCQKHINNALNQPLLVRNVADLPGPTGESNRLSTLPAGVVLCLGPSAAALKQQMQLAKSYGCPAINCCSFTKPLTNPKSIEPNSMLTNLDKVNNFAAVMFWGDKATMKKLHQSLAKHPGPILPLITNKEDSALLLRERHLCINTTAAGGNTTLLTQSEQG